MNNIAHILGNNNGDKGDMPNELQTTTYNNLMKVYDDIENIIEVATKLGSDADPYLKNLRQLVEVVEKNIEIVSKKFFDHIETGEHTSNIEKLKVEKAVKNINMAIQQFLVKVK